MSLPEPEDDNNFIPFLPHNTTWEYVYGAYQVYRIDIRKRINAIFREYKGHRGPWWMNHWSLNFTVHYDRYLITIRRRRWEYGESKRWRKAVGKNLTG